MSKRASKGTSKGAEEATAGRWSALEMLFNIGWSLTVTACVAAFTRDRWGALANPSLTPGYLSRVLGLVLLVATMILVVRYILAAHGEMRMLRFYLSEFVPPTPPQVVIWTVTFSIVMGVLAFYSDRVVVFAALLVAFTLGDMWAQAIRNRELRQALKHARRQSTEQTRQRHWAAIERFYLEVPQIPRSATVMFFGFTALILGLVREFDQSIVGAWLECAAFGVVIATIVISELVIFRWRRQRDRDLGEFYSI